jgi:signal-transduction protein with cAMP-binding, CBS, and nucleotidyltransferase domain
MVSIDSVMHKPIVTAAADECVDVAARRMREAGVGAVVLIEDNAVAGIFTERDLLTAVVAEGRPPESTRVGEVATREVLSVEVGAPLRACAEALRDRAIRHLPVVDDGRPIGILSARDFFGAVSDGFEKVIGRARFDEEMEQGADPYDHLGGSYGR